MDIFVQYAVAIAAIIGLVNGFRLLEAKDFRGFALFILAVAAGLLFGWLHWFMLPSLEIGFLAGLASSGFYRLKQV